MKLEPMRFELEITATEVRVFAVVTCVITPTKRRRVLVAHALQRDRWYLDDTTHEQRCLDISMCQALGLADLTAQVIALRTAGCAAADYLRNNPADPIAGHMGIQDRVEAQEAAADVPLQAAGQAGASGPTGPSDTTPAGGLKRGFIIHRRGGSPAAFVLPGASKIYFAGYIGKARETARKHFENGNAYTILPAVQRPDGAVYLDSAGGTIRHLAPIGDEALVMVPEN